MIVERGSFSVGSTGNITILFANPSLTATEIEFSLGPTGTSLSTATASDGYMNGTQQTSRSLYTDSTGSKVTQVNNKCITHQNRVSGAITEIITATRVSLATAGEFTVNFSAVNVNYIIFFRARSA